MGDITNGLILVRILSRPVVTSPNPPVHCLILHAPMCNVASKHEEAASACLSRDLIDRQHDRSCGAGYNVNIAALLTTVMCSSERTKPL
jgi:hypothetical protein